MTAIFALVFAILMLVKSVCFLVAPSFMMGLINQFFSLSDKIGAYLHYGILAFAVVIGLILSKLVGFFALVAMGWFWCAFYGLFILPVAINLHKRGYLKNFVLDPENKNKFLIGCIFAILLSVLTIGLVI